MTQLIKWLNLEYDSTSNLNLELRNINFIELWSALTRIKLC